MTLYDRERRITYIPVIEAYVNRYSPRAGIEDWWSDPVQIRFVQGQNGEEHLEIRECDSRKMFFTPVLPVTE